MSEFIRRWVISLQLSLRLNVIHKNKLSFTNLCVKIRMLKREIIMDAVVRGE
ncbi:hypothetical protein H8E77_06410 [bacterium]|nr:hypothetical protein [bacterium]